MLFSHLIDHGHDCLDSLSFYFYTHIPCHTIQSLSLAMSNKLPTPNPSVTTNPWGRQLLGYYNNRTEWTPRKLQQPHISSLSKFAMLVGFFGVPIGYMYAVKNQTYRTRVDHEHHYSSVVLGHSGVYPTANVPENTPVHVQTLTPYENHISLNSRSAFGYKTRFTPEEVTQGHANMWLLEQRKENDPTYQFDSTYHLQNYMVAAPKEDYDAIKLKATWRLAAAAYYQDRAPGIYLPLDAETDYISQVRAEIDAIASS